jgi:SAM-dependent methyltransferase
MSLGLRARRFVPSISRLTYVPVVKWFLDLFDIIPRLLFREFRGLPPNHLRCRVGVGNRLFFNQALYLMRGERHWLYWMSQGWCGLDSDIVELGVGCGRRAFHIRDLAHHDEKYTGSYLGIDIDAEALEWCRQNFDKRFEFVQSSHEGTSYVNDQSRSGSYRIPRDDDSVDFVFGMSVFTHLLEDEVRNYLEEGARILHEGGKMVVSCFCIDLNPRKVGDRHSFQHRIGEAYVESLRQPGAAVAYDSTFLRKAAVEAGFADAEIYHSTRDVQHDLVCTR